MKKIQLLLLVLLLALPFNSYAQQTLYGDVNSDLEVNLADVNSVIDIILDGTAVIPTADVNGDLEINLADVNAIIDIILNPSQVPDNVHIYGDTPGSEGSVLSVTDETVVLTCPLGEEPIVGDIIVSGVTDNAPYGFLRRVEAVEKTRGGVVVTTTNASLEEVLPDGNYHIDIPLVAPGQLNSLNSTSQAPSRAKFSTDFKGTIKIGWKGNNPDIKFDVWPSMTPAQEKKKEDEVLNGKPDTFYPLQFIAKLSPSLNLFFDCSVKKRKLQRVELGGEIEVKSELIMKGTLEKEFKRVGLDGFKLPGSIDLTPVTMTVGIIPVVFTPKLDFYLGVDIKGELYLQCKLMSASAKGDFSYVYTREPDPVTGENHNFYKNFDSKIQGDGDWGKWLNEWSALKVGAKGYAKGIISPAPNVSVYHANDIFQVSTPLSPWAKVEGNLSITLDPNNYQEQDAQDNITITGGVDIGIAAVFNLLGKKEVWPKDFTLFETELMEPFALTPRFDRLRITPDDDPIPTATPVIAFDAYMTKPNYQLLPDDDYGFAYGLKDIENRNATWTFISLKDQYDPEFEGDISKQQHVQAQIDATALEKNKTYRVCPYVTIYGVKIYKKGSDFKIDKEGDWVDLGLPSGTIWATRNVGASAPEEYGDYFAWGETTPRNSFYMNSYTWYSNRTNFLPFLSGFTKYCTKSEWGYDGFVDNKTVLDPEDDAARAHYSGGCMPSSEQIKELCNHCTWQWTQRNGVNGQLVTGPNGNTMFLPAAGYRWEDSLNDAGLRSIYWSRMLYSDEPGNAYGLHIYLGKSPTWSFYGRPYGFSVRAVRVSQN